MNIYYLIPSLPAELYDFCLISNLITSTSII